MQHLVVGHRFVILSGRRFDAYLEYSSCGGTFLFHRESGTFGNGFRDDCSENSDFLVEILDGSDGSAHDNRLVDRGGVASVRTGNLESSGLHGGEADLVAGLHVLVLLSGFPSVEVDFVPDADEVDWDAIRISVLPYGTENAFLHTVEEGVNLIVGEVEFLHVGLHGITP